MTGTAGANAVGVVLAAGRSSRAAFPKALATLGGEPLVARAVRTLREGGCDRVVVVVGPPHGEAVAAAARAAGAIVAQNPEPERGMLSSLQAGLAAAGAPAALVLSLVDHPRVRPETVAALAARLRAGVVAVRPRHGGRTGHPAVLSAAVAAELAAAPPTASVRDVVGARWTDVDVDDPGVVDDLDTAEALAALGVRPPRAAR